LDPANILRLYPSIHPSTPLQAVKGARISALLTALDRAQMFLQRQAAAAAGGGAQQHQVTAAGAAAAHHPTTSIATSSQRALGGSLI
jgi:hypothetical protein